MPDQGPTKHRCPFPTGWMTTRVTIEGYPLVSTPQFQADECK